MKISRLPPKLTVALLMLVIFFISILFRVILPHDQVFNDGWVKFTSTDAYFYQRIIDNTAANFPHVMNFDPYFIIPGGRVLGELFFPSWLIAGFTWLFGMGSPSQHTVDVVSVFFPAIFAALTIIPVFFIGKTLFNRWVGLIAAAFTAIFPGEYLGRTILGLTDTPASEVLLTTTFMCFAILAVKTARERELTFGDILRRDWSRCLRPLIYSVLAGVFLGLYLISWQGALLFVFIFTLYLVIQFVVDHLRRRAVDYLGIVGCVTFLIALLIYFSFSLGAMYIVALLAALLIPVALAVVSRLMSGWKVPPLYYPAALVVGAGIALGLFYLASPDLFHSMVSPFSIFAPSGATAQTTIEMQPLLDPFNSGIFTTTYGWGNFTTSFFLGQWWLVLGLLGAAAVALFYRYLSPNNSSASLPVFLFLALVVACVFAGIIVGAAANIDAFGFPGLALIALSILIYLYIRKNVRLESYWRHIFWVLVILVVIMAVLLLHGYGHHALSLVPLVVLFALLLWPGGGQKSWLPFLVWTLVILALALSQRRYAYYLVINISLLSAYLCWQIIWFSGVRALAAKPAAAPAPVPAGKAKAKKRPTARTPGLASRVVSVSLAGLAVFLLVFFPNLVFAGDMTSAAEASYSPSDAWMASLDWLRQNSPEPFGDPAAYYHQYDIPPPAESFDYPASAYGVTAWWDYGYWILQIAHRIPSANPSQEPEPIRKVAALFLAQDDAAAAAIMAELDSSYVIGEYDSATIQLAQSGDSFIYFGKFHAILTWAEKEQSDYYDVFYVPDNFDDPAQYTPHVVYFPDYYHSLYVRLYNFNGAAVSDITPVVITWVEDEQGGQLFKRLTAAEDFTSYQEALDYLNGLGEGLHAIVGTSPFVSPISLDAAPGFALVHSSAQGTSLSTVGFVPEVKIFSYTSP
jgi:dolichyl-phosphooligosaccharide-protein glycotransferase